MKEIEIIYDDEYCPCADECLCGEEDCVCECYCDDDEDDFEIIFETDF